MSAVTPPPSSAMALREAFGDRKVPDISRKITACVACRKLKIKCHMNDSSPPCSRCKTRGLSCTVNKSLQMLLENDMTWKDAMEQRIQKLEERIGSLTEAGFLLPEPAYHEDSLVQAQTHGELPSRPNLERDQTQPQQSTWKLVVDSDAGPNTVPASCVSETSDTSSPHQTRSPSQANSDLVARGLLNIQTASRLFDIYQQRLDHFLYSIIGAQSSLTSIRKSSALLTSAICAVSALHSRADDYQTCHGEFTRQVSAHILSKRHNRDDIRGLCIGAFWLSDISWTLIGAAVRIATEINLHRCLVEADPTSIEWYKNMRLYLLVYICDHHFSLPYGRPPMTREFDDLKFVRKLLNSEHACEDDQRLFSQTEIWTISYRVFKIFGIDHKSPLPESCMSDFRRLGIAFDTWRADWEEAFKYNRHVGNYPAKGVGLHFHFAKLYLCSHAFRGSTNTSNAHSQVNRGLEEYSHTAVTSAVSILQSIVVDAEIQSHLDGLPAYFDTMIAFAVVFLLKIVSKENTSQHLQINRHEILILLEQISLTLEKVTASMRPQHLLSGISSSSKKMIEKARYSMQNANHGNYNAAVEQPSGAAGMQPLPENNYNWTLSPDDSIFMGNFDFSGTAQDVDFGFMDFATF